MHYFVLQAADDVSGAVVLFLAVVALLLIILISHVKIVPQAHAYVVERLGRYLKTWETGVHFLLPFLDKISKKVVKMEQVADFPPQPVITKDNVKMQIDTVVFYQITDCKLYAYGVANPMAAIENLTATTLRNIIGELELDATLTSRDIINTRMRVILDEATDPWGIKVNRVELKNIMPPREIQDAMEKQMKAERERRESILRAEGEKKSVILIAEGQKESKILAAEADKQSAILAAEADREARIRRAEGEAQAILKVQQATADGIRMVNEAAPQEGVLAIKAMEAMEKMADGKATKIIIPSDLQGIASLATTASEVFRTDKAEK
jgi:regulator of protease activity HflC (stomatin/prohibitin superfamily)